MRASLSIVLFIALALSGVDRVRATEVSPPALELWKEALDYHRAKDAGRALDTFLKAYRADPAVLGLDSEGLLDRSIDHLRAELNVKKDDLVYTFKLAEVLNLKGSLSESIANYKKVVAINPNSPMAAMAAEEARKLEGFQAALAPPAPPPVAAAPPAPPASPASPASPAAASPDPDPSASPGEDPRVIAAEAKVLEAQEQTAKVQEELDALKEAHAKLQAEYENAKYYKTLYFANPANVELLNKGRIK